MTETKPLPTWEERLLDGVIAQFFAPQWQMSTLFNPATGQNEQQMVQYQSAATRISHDIFSAHKDKILEAVKEKFDLDALVDALWERIRDDVVSRLTDTRQWSGHTPDQQKMRERVNELIAQELARRTLERMDQEQASDASS